MSAPTPQAGLPQELLVCVFIHGFKGTDGTFCGFPERLRHVLHETLKGWRVECVVFPAYETRGELAEATARFVSWLTELTVNLESSHGLRAGGAKIVLCGHSMGGLVAADALLGIAGVNLEERKSKGKEEKGLEEQGREGQEKPMWPRIIACIGYDTPYLGLHPNVFKHSVSQVTSYVDAAKAVASGLGLFGLGAATSTSSAPPPTAPADKLLAPPSPNPEQKKDDKSSSSWAKLSAISPTYVAAAAGTLLAGAAAGTAYYQRQNIAGGWQWASDHLRYVGNLWDEEGMRLRLERVVSTGVVFRNFYTFLPATPPLYPIPRTFSILPSTSSPLRPYFLPQTNKLARDEVDAHIGMFEPKSNDGYYEMGLEVVKAVGEAVERFRPKEPAQAVLTQAGEAGEGAKATVNAAQAANPGAAKAGEQAAADLINLDSPPLSGSSLLPLPPSNAGSSSSGSRSFPPTPSSYPTSGTSPISAVPSSAQFSDLPWSARTASTAARNERGTEKQAEAWMGVPVEGVPVTPKMEQEQGEEGDGEGRSVEGVEMEENPWVGRLRRKERKK